MISLNKILLTACAMMLAISVSFAQNDDDARLEGLIQAESDSLGWTIGGGIGLDLGNVLIINPKPGSGQNRWGIGGAIGLFANYRAERFKWFNNISLNLSIEKNGSGTLPDTDEKVPFRKGIDELRLNSTAGYSFKPGSKWSWAADFWFRSQLLPSYQGIEDGQIYLSEITTPGPYENFLVSKLFAPARFNLGLGVMYDPEPKWTFVFTPLTADLIYISDQDIANLGVHGTFLKEGSDTEYEKSRWGLGAKLTSKYQNQWLDGRLTFSSTLGLFSDYLNNPQNIDVDWTNELAFKIIENLSLSYTGNIYYDHDILSFVTDNGATGGIERNPDGTAVLAPTVNYYHQILLKFTQVF